MDLNTPPLVSIVCISYNHASFIREAIDGFLMQKTKFDFEILIHDDASTDNTASIVREYAAKDKRIITILQTENQYSKGINPGVEYLYPIARGKYIAACEGDDYWTDSNKLQKQIDFLEANPEFSGSAHQSLVKTGDSEKLFNTSVKSDIVLADLLKGRIFHTASLVFRRDIITKHQIPPSITSHDRALFFQLVAYGPIHYFDDVMCVYRKHEGGISSRVTYDLMKADLEMIPWLVEIIPNFPKYRYLAFIHRTIFVNPQKISLMNFWKHYFLYAWFSFSYFPGNLKGIAYYPLRSIMHRLLP